MTARVYVLDEYIAWVVSDYFLVALYPTFLCYEGLLKLHILYDCLFFCSAFSTLTNSLVCMKEFLTDLQMKTMFCELVLLTAHVLRMTERKE